MAVLHPIPLSGLVHRALREPALQQSLFDLPLRKCWTPGSRTTPDQPPGAAPDLSVALHGHRAQTPVGPAAGPHAQLAQNIVLAWAAGARIIELKTVQILDQLKIPRPCIDAATIGFNVEWSQELPLERSLREYVAGAMLVRMLRQLDPFGLGASAAQAEPIFELSVGYSLEGLQHPRMRRYLERVRDTAPIIAELRDELHRELLGSAAPEHRALLDLDHRADLVSCVTLSTFHGCPPAEIESIARYLIDEHGFDVIVKFNPTLLGFDEVCHLLRDRLGYHELRPRKSAFDSDLRWEEAVAMARRLSEHAASRGRAFGVKMTNTLVVENHKTFFGDKEMYLSGAPLHVLAMHCVDRFRAALGPSIPLSFSGGIDAGNVVDAVACDLVPVTTCTDLLRPGGYGRLARYLTNLEEAMLTLGAPDRDELVLRRFGKAPEAIGQLLDALREDAGGDHGRGAQDERLLDQLEAQLMAAARERSITIRAAIDAFRGRPGVQGAGLGERLGDLHARLVAVTGTLNAHEVAERVTGDPRYGAGKNGKPPRKVGTQLVLLDCLSCDKCVPVCPNDANFSLDTPIEETSYADLALDEAGALTTLPEAGKWKVGKPAQWANYADACNECGNCDVFCPESGGPYVMKARFFGSRASFEESPALDGLLLEREAGQLHASARIDGRPYRLVLPDSGPAILDDGVLRVTCDRESGAPIDIHVAEAARGPHRLSGAIYLTLRTLIRGALDPARINPVSAQLRDPGLARPPIR